MTLTLQSRALWSISIHPRRINCSGRGIGTRSLGLRTTLAEPALGSLEA
jgi:hypothetical protein